MTGDKLSLEPSHTNDPVEREMLHAQRIFADKANEALKFGSFEDVQKYEAEVFRLSGMILTRRREHALMLGFDERQKASTIAALFLILTSINKSNPDNACNTKPPRFAEYITRAITKPKIADRILDCRAEIFAKHISKRGLAQARAFYWIDTLKSCWPALKGLARWAMAGEIVRRWLGS